MNFASMHSDLREFLSIVQTAESEVLELDLSYKKLSDADCLGFAPALRQANHINKLQMSNNEIGHSGVAVISECLRNNFIHLSELDIGTNSGILSFPAALPPTLVPHNFSPCISSTSYIPILTASFTSTVFRQLETRGLRI